MGQFAWSVRVAGGEVRDLVLDDTATIRYGRATIDVQPEPTNATLTLLTYDAAPSLFEDKPSYILDSENIPSGFVAEWQEHYDGVVTVLELGASVEIDIAGVSGFTAQWSEIYLGVLAQSNRFRGHVIAMDYRPGTLTLTAATDQENLGRVTVGGSGRAAQTDAQRVQEISTEAGVPITVEAGQSMNLRALPEYERSAWSALQQVCDDVGGLLYTDREGVVRYRQRGGYEPVHHRGGQESGELLEPNLPLLPDHQRGKVAEGGKSAAGVCGDDDVDAAHRQVLVVPVTQVADHRAHEHRRLLSFKRRRLGHARSRQVRRRDDGRPRPAGPDPA